LLPANFAKRGKGIRTLLRWGEEKGGRHTPAKIVLSASASTCVKKEKKGRKNYAFSSLTVEGGRKKEHAKKGSSVSWKKGKKIRLFSPSNKEREGEKPLALKSASTPFFSTRKKGGREAIRFKSNLKLREKTKKVVTHDHKKRSLSYLIALLKGEGKRIFSSRYGSRRRQKTVREEIITSVDHGWAEEGGLRRSLLA